MLLRSHRCSRFHTEEAAHVAEGLAHLTSWCSRPSPHGERARDGFETTRDAVPATALRATANVPRLLGLHVLMKQVAVLGDTRRGPGTDPGPAEATACNPCPPRDGRLAGLSNKFRVGAKAKSQLRHMLRRGPGAEVGEGLAQEGTPA